MGFRYDTICHFRCNNQLSTPTGRVSLLLGLKFGTRGMWAVMQMAGEEEIFRNTIDCPCQGHLLKYGFVPSCIANSCDEKALNGPPREHSSAFHGIVYFGPMPRAVAYTSLSLKDAITVALSEGFGLSLVLQISVLQITYS